VRPVQELSNQNLHFSSVLATSRHQDQFLLPGRAFTRASLLELPEPWTSVAGHGVPCAPADEG
jgi:hypothetical protein